MNGERFVKKPIEIEAKWWDGTAESAQAIVAWINEGERDGLYISVPGLTDSISIGTLEGDMHATPGDWVIKGVEGEFYPCKPGTFEKSYTAADADCEPTRTELLTALDDVIDVAIWLTGTHDLSDAPAWPEMAARLHAAIALVRPVITDDEVIVGFLP